MTTQVKHPQSAFLFNDYRHRVSLTLEDLAAETGLSHARVVAFATGELECPDDIMGLLIDHFVKLL